MFLQDALQKKKYTVTVTVTVTVRVEAAITKAAAALIALSTFPWRQPPLGRGLG
jgi:hypothetical protein